VARGGDASTTYSGQKVASSRRACSDSVRIVNLGDRSAAPTEPQRGSQHTQLGDQTAGVCSRALAGWAGPDRNACPIACHSAIAVSGRMRVCQFVSQDAVRTLENLLARGSLRLRAPQRAPAGASSRLRRSPDPVVGVGADGAEGIAMRA
jgi:hypothetical protein